MWTLLKWTLTIGAVSGGLWWIQSDPPDPSPLWAMVTATQTNAPQTDATAPRLWICPAAGLSKPSRGLLKAFAAGVSQPDRLWSDLTSLEQESLDARRDAAFSLLHGVSRSAGESPTRMQAALVQLEDHALEQPVTLHTVAGAELPVGWKPLTEEPEHDVDIPLTTPYECLQQLEQTWNKPLPFAPLTPRELHRVSLVGRLSLHDALRGLERATWSQDHLRSGELLTSPPAHQHFHGASWRLYPLQAIESAELLNQDCDTKGACVRLPGGMALCSQPSTYTDVDDLWRLLCDRESLGVAAPPELDLPAAEWTLSALASEVARQTGGGVALVLVARQGTEEGVRRTPALQGPLPETLPLALAPWGLHCLCEGRLVTIYQRQHSPQSHIEYVFLAHLGTEWPENPPTVQELQARQRPTRRRPGWPPTLDARSFHSFQALTTFLKLPELGTYALGDHSPGIVLRLDDHPQGNPQGNAVWQALCSDSPLARLARALHYGPRGERTTALEAALAGDDPLAIAFAIDRIDPQRRAILRPQLLRVLATGRVQQADLLTTAERLVQLCSFGQHPPQDLLVALDQMAGRSLTCSTAAGQLLGHAQEGYEEYRTLFARWAPHFLEQIPASDSFLREMLTEALRFQTPATQDAIKWTILARRRELLQLGYLSADEPFLLPVLLEGLRDSDPDQRRAICEILQRLGRWSRVAPRRKTELITTLERLRQDPLVAPTATDALREVDR